MSCSNIIIHFSGKLFTFKSEPYETNEDTHARAWYILKNMDKYPRDILYSFSIIENNKKKGMYYNT